MSHGFHDLVGLSVDHSGEGRARVAFEADDQHLNSGGSVHGGAIATLCDTAMGLAVAAAGAESPVTIEMKVTYLTPGDRGILSADAVVRKTGKRIVVAEAEVTQGDETIALAMGTFANRTG